MKQKKSGQSNQERARSAARLEQILLVLIFLFSLLLAGVILSPVVRRALNNGVSPDREAEESAVLFSPADDTQYVYADLRDDGVTYQFALGPNGRLILRETGEETEIWPLDTDGDGFADYGYTEIASADPTLPTVRNRVELYADNGLPFATYAAYPVPMPTQQAPTTGWLTRDGKRYYAYGDGSRAVGLHRIDGKLYYFNERGECAKMLGVDVSIYDERIDWPAVKEQGIDFAIVRVGGRGWSSGLHYGDIRTQENLIGARDAGIKLGLYFFSTAVDEREAKEDALAALEALNGYPLDLPIFIDLEYSGIYPEGRSDQLSGAQRASIARAFCETVRAAGYQAGVYSGQNYFKYSLDYSAVAEYTIWLASYTRNNRLPDFSERYDIWQFTDRGTVRGIAGYSDMDVIF